MPYELLNLETSDSLEGYKGDGHRKLVWISKTVPWAQAEDGWEEWNFQTFKRRLLDILLVGLNIKCILDIDEE